MTLWHFIIFAACAIVVLVLVYCCGGRLLRKVDDCIKAFIEGWKLLLVCALTAVLCGCKTGQKSDWQPHLGRQPAVTPVTNVVTRARWLVPEPPQSSGGARLTNFVSSPQPILIPTADPGRASVSTDLANPTNVSIVK